MILSWMAYAMLCAALCAVAGACADAALRHRLRQRRVVWMVTMVASVVLPLAIPLLVPPSTEAIASNQAPSVTVPVFDAVSQVAAINPPSRVDWSQLVIVLWICGSMLLAASLIVSSTRLNRRLRGYRRANIDGQSLLVSEDFGPAVVGLLHPIIVLPAWALKLADVERRLVVSHELEHQRAGDPAVTIGALLVVALFPWNVALWWQLSRLRLTIEFDCDARVVAHYGADPFAYGNVLLTAHENAGQTRLAALALAPIRSALGKRINALVVRGTQSRSRTLSAVGIAALALSALGFAPVPELPRSVVNTLASSETAGQQLVNEQQAPAQPTLRLVETQPIAASPNSAPAKLTTKSRTESPTGSGSSTYSMLPPSESLRDVPNNVTVRAKQPNMQSSAGSERVSTLTAISRVDTVRKHALPDSNVYAVQQRGGTFGMVGAAEMRDGAAPAPAGGRMAVMQAAPISVGTVMGSRGGGYGGQITKQPPLKTYTGGFMNAEVPARADSTPPSIR